MTVKTDLHTKIVEIRKEKKLTISAIHRKITEIFGDNALAYRTLLRIMQGETEARDATLYQVCLALGITTKELKESVPAADLFSVGVIRRKKRKSRYIYNQQVSAEVLSAASNNLNVLEMVLKRGGMTKPEQDPDSHEKWVYVLQGKLVCNIGGTEYQLAKEDALCFKSSLPHHFQNKNSRKTRCLIVRINYQSIR